MMIRTPVDEADEVFNRVAMTKAQFTYSIDRCDIDGNVIEHLADIDDLMAVAASTKPTASGVLAILLEYGRAPA
jgi:hypothetical protein